jgi:VCBS repeat-containing protein
MRRRHPSTPVRTRRLFLEQFEDRRMLYAVDAGNSISGILGSAGWMGTDGNSHDGYGDITSSPSHGSASLSVDSGSVTFEFSANLDYTGNDSFSYEYWSQSDATWNEELQEWEDPTDGHWTTGTVTVDVYPAPTSGADTFLMLAGATLNQSAPGVLANDTVNHGTPTAVLDMDAAQGTVTLNDDGSFAYTPESTFAGWDSFSYHVYDGLGFGPLTPVFIRVDHAPSAGPDSYTTAADDSSIVHPSVLANDADADHDSLAATLLVSPAHGSVNLNADGTFTYAPDSDYTGPDSFTYSASDGFVSSDETTVSLTVVPVTNNIIAAGDDFLTPLDAPLTVAAPGLLVNDTPAGSAPLSAVLVAQPSHGTVALAADGSFSYTPTGGYAGDDSFSYRAVGADGAASAASQLSTTIIAVGGGSDIMITGFYSDGYNLYVQYLVAGAINQAFSIGVYSSGNGTTLDDLPLESAAGITSQGVHTATIAPTFDDWQADYYLVAKVDSNDEITETNENNNALLFAGGAFLVHEALSGKTVLHAQGPTWRNSHASPPRTGATRTSAHLPPGFPAESPTQPRTRSPPRPRVAIVSLTTT